KDSHLELPSLSISRKRFDELELVPFIEAITNNVGGIMAAHIIATAFDEKYPATLSRKVITDLLRGELDFSGLVFTDALIMHAITKNYSIREAAKLAALAGCDILLMPEDVDATLNALFEESQTNPELKQCIERANDRIARAKDSVTTNKVHSAIDIASHVKFAEQIASQAIRLTGNQSIVGKRYKNMAFVLVGAEKEEENIKYAQYLIYTNANEEKLRVKLYINRQTPIDIEIDCLILMIFNGVYSFQGDLGDKSIFFQQAEQCLASGAANVIGVSFGSPYIWNELPSFPVTMDCFSNSCVSIRTAVEKLFGK
ncbi:MAG TPA: glycoside hydrolase family 3 N-terminal domain-containing protein, partial [Candidatus Kapabacteria bacterium]|nr:glycoside hydrolase family 3 N-terminal domain-containing protein [Candidatus Kapabacteria bacterium]